MSSFNTVVVQPFSHAWSDLQWGVCECTAVSHNWIGLLSRNQLEVCSAHPTSGGPYFWAAMLSKPKHAPLASWICGWYVISSVFNSGFCTKFWVWMQRFNLLGQVAVTTGIRSVMISIFEATSVYLVGTSQTLASHAPTFCLLYAHSELILYQHQIPP